MKYILHYAELNLNDDIPKFEFTSSDKRNNFISDKMYEGHNRVFLLCIEHSHEFSTVLVFDRSNSYAFRLIEKDKCLWENMFLFEYDSYEAAYQTALDIMETNKLCYDPS